MKLPLPQAVLEFRASGEQTRLVNEAVVIDLRSAPKSIAHNWFDQDLTTEELAETVMAINASLRAS